MQPKRPFFIASYFFFAALQAVVVIILLWNIPGDPKNTLYFSLSLSRIGLMGGMLIAALCMYYAGWHIYNRIPWTIHTGENIDSFLRKGNHLFSFIMACLLGTFWSGYFYLTILHKHFSSLQASLERLSPLVLWVAILTLQTVVWLLIRYRQNLDWQTIKSQRKIWIACLISTGFFLCVWFWIALSGTGIIPDKIAWGMPGTPLLIWQVLLTLSIGIMLLLIQDWFKQPPKSIGFTRLDWIIGFVLWSSAVLIWILTPLKPSYFAPAPVPPNVEYYPYSDAALHDVIAQNLLIGEGLGGGGGKVVRRPLYALFLAGLHALAGQDYLAIITLQILVLASIPFTAYLLAARLQSRLAGILIAILLILEEQNAISLSGIINVSHSKLLMSDTPTALCVLIFTTILVYWLQNAQKRLILGLLAGGVLGAVMLIRPQAVVLLGVSALLVFLIHWRKPSLWIKGILLLTLGVVLCTLPWIARNWKLTGTFVFDEPSSAQIGMIAERYMVSADQGSETTLGKETKSDANYSANMTGHILQSMLTHPREVIGFTAAHFMHNIVNLVTTLPLTADALDGEKYIRSQPFWLDQENDQEQRLPPYQDKGILLINLILLATGIGSVLAARRDPIWVGGIPIFIYVGYNLSNALARNSGWRFLLPADWIGLLFYAAGISQVLLWSFILLRNKKADLPFLLQSTAQSHPEELTVSANPTYTSRSILKYLSFALLILSFGALIPLSEYLVPARYSEISKTDWLPALLKQDPNLSKQAGFEIIKQSLKSDKAAVLWGRALYPRFYKARQGITAGTPSTSVRVRDYNRIGFQIIGTKAYQVVLPTQSPPDYFPNAADVYVVGCPSGNYVDALAVIVMDLQNPNQAHFYLRNPLTWVMCP